MTVHSVRTVRASSSTPRTSTSTPRPVSPFSEAIATFAEDIKRFDTVDCDSSREALARLVAATNATGADVAAATKAVEDATKALKGFREDRDALVTRQRRAIRAALKAGFKGTEVGAAFGVSGGTVSNVQGGLLLKAALLKGGAESKTLPSDDALVSRVAKAAKTTGGKAALIKAAKATGTLPEDGDVPTFTAAQTLARVQAALTAVKHIVRADGDTATVEAIREALETLSTATIA